MPQPPDLPSRTPRLIAVAVLLAALLGSLVTTLAAPPAGAVPVDGLFSGTITSPTSAPGTTGPSSASIGVRLETNAPNRFPVKASITLSIGLAVSCLGTQGIPPAPAAAPLVLNGVGGAPSAAPSGSAPITITGNISASGIVIPVLVTATVSPARDRLVGTAVLDLPGGFPGYCSDAVLSFDLRSDQSFAIRTGHDGTTVGGIDLTHLIDREPAAAGTEWERCMFLWATPPGAPPASAIWFIEGAAPPGAHIRSGWASGDPTGGPAPLRTQVCITAATPADTTFTVAIAPGGGAVAGRVLLWVGNHVNYAGRAQGDVHNTTFDEARYDFQGVGEYVDAVAGDGTDLAVQSRLETVPGAPVTVTTAVAARVNGDRVVLALDAKGQPQWSLDGRPLSVPTTLPSGGEITNPTADHWRVTWPAAKPGPGSTAGTSMQLSFGRWAPKDHLNIDELILGPGLGDGQVRGLFGVADRDPANDLTPSTGGSPVSPDIDPASPPATQPLYAEFGRSWLVTTKPGPTGTLFDYTDPAHPDPASYQDERFPAERPGVVDRNARAACRKAGVTAWPQIDFCTYDVEVTGAREIARYYRDGWLPV